MMNNMNAIVEMLLADSRGKAEEILAQARAEASGITAATLEAAQEECAQIRRDYEEQARDGQRRSLLNEKMEMRHMLLAAKQALADQVVEKVRERFMAQSTEEWISLLTMLLERNCPQAMGAKPEIIVPAAYTQAVQEAVGPEYSVTPGQMAYGFIFSFPDYDLNYEAERLFQYQKEALERKSIRLLFEDDAHD